MKIGLSARSGQHERPTCVYCRDEVGPTDALGLCPACGVTFHEPCRAELTRCPTPGCVGLDEQTFAARQRADEEAEREARRAEARARREAEDRGESPPSALRHAPSTRQRAAAREEPIVDPLSEPAIVHRATTRNGLALAGLGGGLIGGLVGLAIAYLQTRHGVALDAIVTWVPAGVALGFVEGLVIGGLGVRRPARGDTTFQLVAVLVGASAMGANLANELGAPWLVGLPLGLLVGLPLALRFVGLPAQE